MGQTAAIGSGGGYRVAPEMIEFCTTWPALRAGFPLFIGLDGHPALTGRATDWRGPPDRGHSVPHEVPSSSRVFTANGPWNDKMGTGV